MKYFGLIPFKDLIQAQNCILQEVCGIFKTH